MHIPNLEDPADALAVWLCLEVLPHERDARRWLQRSGLRVDADDIIQEAYARIAALDNVGHIRSGRAYFLTAVRSIALQQLRRSKIVELRPFCDVPEVSIMDDSPGQEAVVWAEREAGRLIQTLPERCRSIFRMCRLDGYTQKETATALGLSEGVVEKQMAKAMAVLTTRFGREDSEP